MSRSYTSSPPSASMACSGTAFKFIVHCGSHHTRYSIVNKFHPLPRAPPSHKKPNASFAQNRPWLGQEGNCIRRGNQQRHGSLRAWETVNSFVHSAELNDFWFKVHLPEGPAFNSVRPLAQCVAPCTNCTNTGISEERVTSSIRVEVTEM
jgi:hypothetical protein